MWFLFLEILILLILAALFGAWLAHWWITRRYADVSETYDSLATFQGPDLTPMEARLGNVETAIGNLTFPETDLSPLDTRLLNLERTVNQFRVPEPDLSVFEDRLMAIESALNAPRNDGDMDAKFSSLEGSLASLHTATADLQNTDITTLERQMDIIASAIAEREDTDLTPVEARLSGIEDAVSAVVVPEVDVDLGPIHSGLTRVEMALANMDLPTTDLSGLETRINTLQDSLLENRSLSTKELESMQQSLQESLQENRLLSTRELESAQQSLQERLFENRSLSAKELESAQQRLEDIETRIALIRMPETDLRPVDEGLTHINMRLSNLEGAITQAAQQTVDLSPLQQRIEQLQIETMRLERMEGTLGTLRMDIQQSTADLDPVHQQIDRLHRDIANQPAPDFSPIVNSVNAIERRMDFAAMEHRLTSIEYGLAALHHMVRTRQAEPAANRKSAPARAPQSPPAGFAAPPPPEPQTYRAPPPREPWADPVPMPPAFEAPHEPRAYDYEYEPAPPPPPRDAVSEARRPDDKANLLTRPAFGPADDLEEISGVGPMLHGLLTEIGVYYFWQVAEWGPAEVEWVDDMLDGFNGRIERDDWVGQAKILATGENAAKRP